MSRAATKKRPAPKQGETRIPLEAIVDLIDWQTGLYDDKDDKQALIRASDAIYEHLHKDDPDEPHGN